MSSAATRRRGEMSLCRVMSMQSAQSGDTTSCGTQWTHHGNWKNAMGFEIKSKEKMRICKQCGIVISNTQEKLLTSK